MTSEHLAEIFSIYGPVASAEIEKDSRVGLSKGSAYVTFKKSNDMNHAMLHLDGAQLDGNVIKATFVLVANKRRREPSPGVSLVEHTDSLPDISALRGTLFSIFIPIISRRPQTTEQFSSW